MIHAAYLADGVYAQVDPNTMSIVLTTGAHFDSHQAEMVIYLDPEVLVAFTKYLERIRRLPDSLLGS